jgi:hypothetical protein
MKLLSLQIFPRGKAGLGSHLLQFGDDITQLYGPNGSGKTPTVQSIAFCLGYNSIFREDIYNLCEHASLKFSIDEEVYVSSRVYSKDFDITIEQGGKFIQFFNEREFSSFLFSLLKLDADRRLVSLSNAVASPYVSTLLPLYYLDQDNGYNSFYSAPGGFIKDQHSEMVRIAFGLPAKNSFDQKKDLIELKRKAESLDKLVSERDAQLADARSQYEVGDESATSLLAELGGLQVQLDGFKASTMTQNDSVNAMQQVVKENLRTIAELDFKLRDFQARIEGKRKIIDEINTEINTLSLNEDARRIFMSFDEICGASQCGMFMKSSSSYGKNLLYLRDQIKDLDRNAENDERQRQIHSVRREQLISQNKEIEESQAVAMLKTESDALIDAISTIKGRMFSIQLRLADRRKVEVLERRYFDAYAQRENTLNQLQELGTESTFSPEFSKVRSEFRKKLIRWLDVLNTSNVSFDISFRNDFVPIFGSETVSQLKGSTKLRTVLAYHAAFIEQMCEMNGSLRVFILDTPKQHDINNDDLNSFFLALKKMARSFDVQIIFSSTEYHYVGDENDTEWNPVFSGGKQLMYLGTVS